MVFTIVQVMCGMKSLSLQSEIFTRGVEEVITSEELKNLLKSGKPLRIKHGIDATAPDLHIGHAANLWKIRALQEAGHKAVILLGDITTEIGDPTGRTKTRPILNKKEIARNAAALEKQIKKILLVAPARLELHKSSEWYKKMSISDFIKLLSMVTHARLIERDMFQQRIKKREEIYENELIYPVLQGYDSVMLKSDLTIIGSDQLFNEHMGRALQEKFGQKPQVIVTLKLLPGLDGGGKMSKSLGNYIGLADSPRDKFGKAMRLLDSLLLSYLEVYTDVPLAEIQQMGQKLKAGQNPMEVKLFFAQALVRRYHGEKVAKQEREYFLEVFSAKELTAIPAMALNHGNYPIVNLLLQLNLASSKSEARRLIAQGAVEISDKKVLQPNEEIKVGSGTVIRVGKRRFVKIR